MPSRTADASEMVKGWNVIRKSQLGFGPDALPLNAQVWMPNGAGPFPLALIVHGNHNAAKRSDGGYAYLGELLASRGIIAATIDQNFLNTSLYNIIFAGLKEENDARAFVLLEHLAQWYDWNYDAAHPFFGKADFENIALIGHSRGGEAAAIAAAFAGLKHYPNNGLLRFNYPFRVKTAVAIAPSHGQYKPAGLEAALANTNYLVLHGGHDQDVFTFMGANTYRRADVSGQSVKAQVWMQHANHGQFNSSWISDFNSIIGLAFNQRLAMPMEEQQEAAKVFISAFLESTLHDRDEYNALFRDFAYGPDWLPATLYVTDYSDGRMLSLDTFDNGFDIGLASSGQAVYSAQGFDAWTQNTLPGKWQNSNRVLILSWGSKKYKEKRDHQTPIFTIKFSENAVSVGDKLYISLCSGRQSAKEPGISFQIRLTDASGNSATMNINDFGGVADPIEARIGKPIFSAIFGTREPVLQMARIPTDQFEGLQGGLASMEWIMDKAHAGKAGQTLYADDLRVEKLN
jgi:pimeloyl-ACP methyl ester carboxylesterase